MSAPADAPQDPAGRFQLDVLTLLERDASAEELTALLGRLEALPVDGGRREALTRGLQLAISLREQLEEQQQRERGLVAVIETARDLTALRDIQAVLEAIVRRARQLVGCQLGYLATFDRRREEFYMRATDGALSEAFRTLRLERGIGLIGLVERTGVPQTSANYEPDDRFPHSEEVDAIFRAEGIRSILGVPLLAGAEVIGVLFVGDRYVRAFRPWELSILSTLAAHATVAILNAQAFEDAQAALAEASRANAQLRTQAEGIHRAGVAHEELTALVAKGGGLSDLCRVVAATLGGTVLVVGEGVRPLAAPASPPGGAATGARGRRPDERIRQALRESRGLGRSVAVPGDRGEICRVSAVGGGSGSLGGLVLWTASDLDEFGVRIFERSAMVTGVVLLSQERTALAANADRSAILRALLSLHQDDPGRLVARASRHGVDLAGPLLLAAVDAGDGQASDLLRSFRTAPGADAMLVDELEGQVVLLAGAARADALNRLLARLIPGGAGVQANAVVSRPVTQPSDLPRIHQSIRRGLGLLRSLRRVGHVASEPELLPYATVFERQGAPDLDALVTAVVGPLLADDRRKGSALAETLLAYLDHGRNARKTAAALRIHVNTLRQRLETVRELLGDWDETPRALEIHLALRLWKLRAG